MLKYLSVLEVEQPATLQEALRFSIELDDYERVPDDPEEYGKQVLERIGADEELISTLDGFTDFEAMGNFYMREDGVRRTEFGLLRKLSDPFPEVCCWTWPCGTTPTSSVWARCGLRRRMPHRRPPVLATAC